jgi:hypothetical protein
MNDVIDNNDIVNSLENENNITNGFIKLKDAQSTQTKVIVSSLTKFKNDLQKYESTVLQGEQKSQIHSKLNMINRIVNDQLKTYHASISRYSKVLDKVRIHTSR